MSGQQQFLINYKKESDVTYKKQLGYYPEKIQTGRGRGWGFGISRDIKEISRGISRD